MSSSKFCTSAEYTENPNANLEDSVYLYDTSRDDLHLDQALFYMKNANPETEDYIKFFFEDILCEKAGTKPDDADWYIKIRTSNNNTMLSKLIQFAYARQKELDLARQERKD